MKKAIVDKVETLTEKQLIELDRFVDNLSKSSSNEYNLLPYIEDLIDERKAVLKKLAQ